MGMHSILFVDDDVDLHELLRGEMMHEGYEMDDAENGRIAIEKLKSRAYDLVLLDITMPEASGLDVLKFIKAEGLKCRVIMLTGVVGLSVAIDSMKLGADDYITKPYNMDYLLASIRRTLEKGPHTPTK